MIDTDTVKAQIRDARRHADSDYLAGLVTRADHLAATAQFTAELAALADPRFGTPASSVVLGRDRYGYIVARVDDGSGHVMDTLLTECCHASAKGAGDTSGPSVVCRACYRGIDPMTGGMPAAPYADHEGVTSEEVTGWSLA